VSYEKVSLIRFGNSLERNRKNSIPSAYHLALTILLMRFGKNREVLQKGMSFKIGKAIFISVYSSKEVAFNPSLKM